MKALSVRQPWAWAILHGGKRVENRSWETRYRGPVLIHASSWWNAVEVRETFEAFRHLLPSDVVPASLRTLLDARGGLVARARIVDCVREHPSPWFMGPHALVLTDVQPVRFVPCRGALGFFEVPPEVERAALELAP